MNLSLTGKCGSLVYVAVCCNKVFCSECSTQIVLLRSPGVNFYPKDYHYLNVLILYGSFYFTGGSYRSECLHPRCPMPDEVRVTSINPHFKLSMKSRCGSLVHILGP